MAKIITFATRPNLIYPLQSLIYTVLRDLEVTLIEKLLNFSDSLVYTLLMFIGEFFAGLIVFLYQKKFVDKSIFKVDVPDKYMNLELIKAKNGVRTVDKIPKMIFILFCCGFYDFIQFLLSNEHKFINVSRSINSRLRGLLIIFDALFYYFFLRLPKLRHQIFCLIIIGSCLLVVIGTEFIFQEINIFLSYGRFALVFILSFFGQFCSALIDFNEKYLFEFNNMNPFYALLFQGIFGFFFSCIYSIFNSPFKELKEFKKNKTTSELIILIFCFIIYIILSGLKNLFRVSTTKIFTPMTTTSLDYILNPIYFIVYFSLGEDFMYKNKRNYPHFFINLFIGLIISFFSLVFNEFIILFFCNLDKDTYLKISERSRQDKNYIKLKYLNKSGNVDNSDDNSNSSLSRSSLSNE